MTASTITISLEGVRLYGYHGVFGQERTVGAEFEAWVDITVPCPEGCETDKLEGTISYADVYEVLKAEFDRPSDLLEHLVARVAKAVRCRWPQLLSLTVKIRKVAPPIPGFQGSASVTMNFR